jgi:hypothetical protein
VRQWDVSFPPPFPPQRRFRRARRLIRRPYRRSRRWFRQTPNRSVIGTLIVVVAAVVFLVLVGMWLLR